MIGLLDCNNFFVSCERLFRPDLINKPAVVLSSNDGVVIARSQEVKDLGVPMGAPYHQVKDILETGQAAIFSGNHELYEDVSKRVIEVVSDCVDELEQYSIDEAFFKLDVTERLLPDTLLALKKHVERSVGIPVSVGMAETKTLAKYASERAKAQDGVFILSEKERPAVMSQVELGKIWGVGQQTRHKLRSHNLLTVGDFLATNTAFIEKVFGVNGLRLQSELSGKVVNLVGNQRELPQSIMSSRSFSKATTRLATVESALTRHVNQAMAELRTADALTSSVRIILGTSRYDDWFLSGGSKEISLSEATDDTLVVLPHVLASLKGLFEYRVPYKKVGVVLHKIVPADKKQLSFFSDSATEEQSGLMGLLDAINKKFGHETLAVGKIKNGGQFMSQKYKSPAYTTKWEELPVVSSVE